MSYHDNILLLRVKVNGQRYVRFRIQQKNVNRDVVEWLYEAIKRLKVMDYNFCGQDQLVKI